MNEQLLKTSGADVLSSRKKVRKTSWGGGGGGGGGVIHPAQEQWVVTWVFLLNSDKDFSLHDQSLLISLIFEIMQ